MAREVEAATDAALLGKCRVSAVAEAHAAAEASKSGPVGPRSPMHAPAISGRGESSSRSQHLNGNRLSVSRAEHSINQCTA